MVPMKGPLLCGPFWVPDLISPIQMFNHLIKVAVVAMETVWVAVGEGLWALRVCRCLFFRMGIGGQWLEKGSPIGFCGIAGSIMGSRK